MPTLRQVSEREPPLDDNDEVEVIAGLKPPTAPATTRRRPPIPWRPASSRDDSGRIGWCANRLRAAPWAADRTHPHVTAALTGLRTRLASRMSREAAFPIT
jgi:hypothetical protein